MKILMIGFGSLGQGLLPLLKSHLEVSSIHIVCAHKKGLKIASEYGASIEVNKLTKNNYLKRMEAYEFDILINVSVDVCSISLIEWCQSHDRLYIDTCVEPWAGGYAILDTEKTTNYYLRTQAFKLKGRKTAVTSHGANPGLISHFVKAALDELKVFFGVEESNYPKLLHDFGIKVIQIAEKDTQISSRKYSSDTFVNTWSVDGLSYEARQKAELGSSEDLSSLTNYRAKRCSFGSIGAYLDTPGYKTRVKSWVPSAGEQEAYMISHHESISISDKFSYQGVRPTVYFAYKPCPQALESWDLLDKNIKYKKVLGQDIVSGHDEFGAFLIGEHFSYWFGTVLDCSQVSIPHNSATTQQVNISIVAAIKWMIDHPDAGLVEAEDICHTYILDIAKPYLGDYGGTFTDFQVESLQLNDFLI